MLCRGRTKMPFCFSFSLVLACSLKIETAWFLEDFWLLHFFACMCRFRQPQAIVVQNYILISSWFWLLYLYLKQCFCVCICVCVIHLLLCFGDNKMWMKNSHFCSNGTCYNLTNLLMDVHLADLAHRQKLLYTIPYFYS